MLSEPRGPGGILRPGHMMCRPWLEDQVQSGRSPLGLHLHLALDLPLTTVVHVEAIMK